MKLKLLQFDVCQLKRLAARPVRLNDDQDAV